MKSQRASKSKSERPALLLSPSEPADLQCNVQKVQLAIAHRAHELFEARGREHGHDLEDWLRAESELPAILDRVLQELGRRPPDNMELL